MNDLPAWKKAGIGAIGGIALAMLKLIEARFYLASPMSVEAIGGYLTYGCFIVLGALAATFLADHELPAPKVRKSAFVLGLLAPSVLLAIANQPVRAGGGSSGDNNHIPPITWLPISTAHAQANSPDGVTRLTRAQLEPSLGDAVSAALGRASLESQYALVVGSTSEKSKAQDTAKRLTSFLRSPPGSGGAQVVPKVVQVEGQSTYFVLLGQVAPKEELQRLKVDAQGLAIRGLTSSMGSDGLSPAERQALASMIGSAPIVPARKLAGQ